jgi:hypothetical protein
LWPQDIVLKGRCAVNGRMGALLGGVVVLAIASCGPAFARDQRQNTVTTAPTAAQAPWYERFTFGSELRDGANAWVPRSELRTEAKVDSRSRWGVTFGVSEEPRPALAPRPGQNNARASAGAFFQVSPKLRVGGAVTLPDERLNATRRREDTKQREPGVKIESAVRF